MTYSQGTVRAVSTTADTAMSNGFQGRPEGELASASGASVASVQLVLVVVGPEVPRHVQSRARHGPESVKGHPNRSGCPTPETRPMDVVSPITPDRPAAETQQRLRLAESPSQR